MQREMECLALWIPLRRNRCLQASLFLNVCLKDGQGLFSHGGMRAKDSLQKMESLVLRVPIAVVRYHASSRITTTTNGPLLNCRRR